MTYFYDLSLLDARGEISAALSIMYHGTELGSFSGKPKQTLDLNKVFAIEVDVTPYVERREARYQYSVVFFERSWERDVWSKKLLQKNKNLKSITTRVQLTSCALKNPKKELHLFTASNRYIDFANYRESVVAHNVPIEYVQHFNQRFVGYLMRSERSFGDMRDLFEKYQLCDVINPDYAARSDYESVRVRAYGLQQESAIA